MSTPSSRPPDSAPRLQRGAILYTLVESYRRHGLDPVAYLREVLTHLPAPTTSQIAELTPEAWSKAQRPACATAQAA